MWDVAGERSRRDKYQRAYAEMLGATSTAYAGWYVIPADHKWFARAANADILVRPIDALKLELPMLTKEQRTELDKARAELDVG